MAENQNDKPDAPEQNAQEQNAQAPAQSAKRSKRSGYSEANRKPVERDTERPKTVTGRDVQFTKRKAQ